MNCFKAEFGLFYFCGFKSSFSLLKNVSHLIHNPYLILSAIRCIAVGKLYHSFPSQCKLEDTNLKTLNILETEKRLNRPQ